MSIKWTRKEGPSNRWQDEKGDWDIAPNRSSTARAKPWRLISFNETDDNGDFVVRDFASIEAAKDYAEKHS